MPCFESWAILFTATSVFDPGNTPLYTLPNPPIPSNPFSLNPLVAIYRSLYEYL
ncbi:hypothetical protein ACHQM5_011535 [Ranunculus cassubicifolius]